MSSLLAIAPEVAEALTAGAPVVALETTIVAHGFPGGVGTAVGLDCEARVREASAVPATVGVLDGHVRLGLTRAELERFDAGAAKAGARDLAVCAVKGLVGATTVGGTLAACRAAGVRFVATGGLGGVHRTFPSTPDVSGDLAELARTEALLVSAGVK
ncbi:MAG: pseudouridine-5'-phosphate glycosidase, partial [Microthrixaceae bacterium]|nr:pseudouridine-5'-phosphate glycosidase [Microthrixaceae bacterium]